MVEPDTLRSRKEPVVATFTTEEIVSEFISRNGKALSEDGDRFDVVRIVRYTSPEGDPDNWGVVYRCEVPMGMLHRYDQETPYICSPKVIWTEEDGLLVDGFPDG